MEGKRAGYGMPLFVLLLVSTVFLISATLYTIAETLDPPGIVLFHFVGWTATTSLIYYDMVDINRG